MNYKDFFNKLIEEDDELKKEYDLLGFKYELISAMIEYCKTYNITPFDLAKKAKISPKKLTQIQIGRYDPTLSEVCKIVYAMDMGIVLAKKEYPTK